MDVQVVKRLFASFFVGGCFGVASQLLVVLWRAVLGPDSPFVMAAMLFTLGLIGGALFVAGIYQRLERATAMGATMPFSGLVSAVASSYIKGYREGGAKRGVAEGFKFFLYVLGMGACVSAAVAAVVFFGSIGA